MQSIGIGLVGFGMIGQVHALAYREIPFYYPDALPPIRLAAVCTTRAESAQKAMRDGGFDAWTDNLETLAARDDVNIIDVCAPNYAHREIVLAALKAGKAVLVDKPLAPTGAEAFELANAARAAVIPVGMVFNYRFVPALMRARQMITDGAVGQVYHFELEYLHTGYQNPNRPMSWRLRKAQAGGGALVDLGSHLIDMVRYLLGEFDQVLATTRTYVGERPVSAKSAMRETVDVDDAAWLNVSLKNGASGTLFVTRFATGAVDDLNVQIYGERGSLKFRLQDANVLQWFDAATPDEPLGGRQGWIHIGTSSRYPGASLPAPRAILGWNRTHAQNIYEFLRALVHHDPFSPDAQDGAKVNQVIDAAYESAKLGEWIKINE